ncbi:hypothetical protein NKJ80_27640 [Mesorhizobium sp. M0030]
MYPSSRLRLEPVEKLQDSFGDDLVKRRSYPQKTNEFRLGDKDYGDTYPLLLSNREFGGSPVDVPVGFEFYEAQQFANALGKRLPLQAEIHLGRASNDFPPPKLRVKNRIAIWYIIWICRS